MRGFGLLEPGTVKWAICEKSIPLGPLVGSSAYPFCDRAHDVQSRSRQIEPILKGLLAAAGIVHQRREADHNRWSYQYQLPDLAHLGRHSGEPIFVCTRPLAPAINGPNTSARQTPIFRSGESSRCGAAASLPSRPQSTTSPTTIRGST